MDEMGYVEYTENISRSYLINQVNPYIVLSAKHFSKRFTDVNIFINVQHNIPRR